MVVTDFSNILHKVDKSVTVKFYKISIVAFETDGFIIIIYKKYNRLNVPAANWTYSTE